MIDLFSEKRTVVLTGPVVQICEGRSSSEVCLRDAGPSWPMPADRPGRCRGRAGSAFPRWSPWNGSWNDGPGNTSSAGVSRAMIRAIGAARARGAPGRTSCKRLAGRHSPDLPGSRGQASRRAPAGCTDIRERSPPGAASPITFRVWWDRRIDRPVARFVARRTRGRGCNQGYDGRWSAAFLQVAAPGRWAGLLIIRRSWVRVPAAPPSQHPCKAP